MIVPRVLYCSKGESSGLRLPAAANSKSRTPDRDALRFPPTTDVGNTFLENQKMNEAPIPFIAVTKRPSAFLPIAMSITALTLVLGQIGSDLIQTSHILHEVDEGTSAHLWQLLMAGQVPILAFFMFRWIPRAPKQELKMLALQFGAVLTNLAVVFFSGLG
jgi:hypothetical protein